MEYLQLIGVLIVIVGFALKWDSILIIFLALISTGFVSGMGVTELLTSIGTNFVLNRGMAIFVPVIVLTGVLERNGLREAASALIGRIKGATPGRLIAVYGPIRAIFGAFNLSIGGVTGFIRPVLLPMAEGAVEGHGHKMNEEHLEDIKGTAAAMENVIWFFFQVLFVGGAGGILVQGTLSTLGYEVELIDLAILEIPVAIASLVVVCALTLINDKKNMKKYYGNDNKEEK